ncbi:CCA tRNA nucleotidyltransferase [Gracilibacillus phocaeensis]|nr:CCA tRNA nucleotidyltransferase [Gracilibacillus phocaeensis]
MCKELFKRAEEIIERLEQAGFAGYIVGGAVRDTLLHRKIGDMDIATDAKPEEVQALFPKVVPTGIQHGTVLVRHHGLSFELTTFRTESGYSDFRRPDQVRFVTELQTDLSRRDFTINAIAMDRFQTIIDPFGGQTDMQRRLVRTVGNPADRFQEDPLRMMRAIRFQAQLGFAIAENTMTAMRAHAHLIRHIAVERLAIEWEKMMTGDYFSHAKEGLLQSGLLRYLPVFTDNQPLHRLFATVDQPFTGWANWIAYMDIACPNSSVTDWVREWKLSNQVKKDSKLLVHLYQSFQHEPIEWTVYQLPNALMDDFLQLLTRLGFSDLTAKDIASYQEQLPIKIRQEMAVDGKDLQQFFPNRPRGAWLREQLEVLEKAIVLQEIVNDYDTIREWLKHGN